MRRRLAEPVSFGVFIVVVVLLGIVFGVGSGFAIQSAIDAHDAKTAAQRQAEGRAVAVDVLCGGVSGIEDAGEQALQGELEGQSPGGRSHGLPARSIRDYVSTISEAVIEQAGVRAGDVLRPDGRIDCDALRVAAKTTSP